MSLINAENYRTFPAVSNSDLGWLAEYWMPQQQVIDLRNAFAQGTLIDCMITEKHRVDYFKYQVKDEPFQYSKEDFQNSEEMKRAFFRDPLCAAMVMNCSFQHITYVPDFQIEYEGLKFSVPAKCKWDLYRTDIDFSGDIKSTACTTQKQCEEAVRYFDYDRSRAWYMDLAGRSNDILIFISKVNYKVFKIPIRRGDKIYTDGKKKYQDEAFHHWYLFGNLSNIVRA